MIFPPNNRVKSFRKIVVEIPVNALDIAFKINFPKALF